MTAVTSLAPTNRRSRPSHAVLQITSDTEVQMTLDYGTGPPRRRINLRWIIAIAIAVIGIISYLGKKQINPVTGEKQYVSMSVDQEKALGLQAAPEMAQKMGGAINPKS